MLIEAAEGPRSYRQKTTTPPVVDVVGLLHWLARKTSISLSAHAKMVASPTSKSSASADLICALAFPPLIKIHLIVDCDGDFFKFRLTPINVIDPWWKYLSLPSLLDIETVNDHDGIFGTIRVSVVGR